jgi:hypothetical protein
MLQDSLEPYEGDSCDVLGSEDGGDGGRSGTHRGLSQYWSNSDLDHDSAVVQYPERAGVEFDADDMLLWDLGGFGETSSSGQVDFSDMGNSDRLREDECADRLC